MADGAEAVAEAVAVGSSVAEVTEAEVTEAEAVAVVAAAAIENKMDNETNATLQVRIRVTDEHGTELERASQ